MVMMVPGVIHDEHSIKQYHKKDCSAFAIQYFSAFAIQ